MMQRRNLNPPESTNEKFRYQIECEIEQLLIRADYFVHAGDNEHALECYDKALAYNATCHDAWIGIGVVYLKQNRRAHAEDIFRKALLMNPGSTRAAIGLALVHCENGNLDEALTMLRLAQKTAPQK
jgi:tetratricopeptide (TPR) repeat protein